jgi:outer membrane protein OmpA-like peptidoglycan-associated protein
MSFRHLCLCLFGCYFVQAQNLVVNPSFEEINYCPSNRSQFARQVTVRGWDNPTTATTDLYARCAEGTAAGLNNNYHGSQQPSDGNNYAGIFLFAAFNYREYVRATISEKITKDKTYRLQFDISISESATALTDSIQILFYAIQPIHLTDTNIDAGQHLKTDSEAFMITIALPKKKVKTEEWYKIDYSFKPRKSGAQHFILGNFRSDGNTKLESVAQGELKSYYYLDNFSLLCLECHEIPIQTDKLYTFEGINFDLDATDIRVEDETQLTQLVNLMLENPTYKIVIEGHTDNQASEEYNLTLSRKRAEAVKLYLINYHIVDDRITVIGYGESRPIVNENTESAYARNRRVMFRLLDSKRPSPFRN